jgi:hypothetical protein
MSVRRAEGWDCGNGMTPDCGFVGAGGCVETGDAFVVVGDGEVAV